MNLRHTYNVKPTSNVQEELYTSGWAIIEAEVLRLNDLSWKLQCAGKQDHADWAAQAANQHIYLFYYALFLRNWLDTRGAIEDQCVATQLEDNFRIACVEDNLPCLSADFKTDYLTTWEQLLSLFGITRQTEGCETGCCLGIGEMIMEGPDDCTAFIIGPCDENEQEEFLGEYEDCAYDDGHNHGEEPDVCTDVEENCN